MLISLAILATIQKGVALSLNDMARRLMSEVYSATELTSDKDLLFEKTPSGARVSVFSVSKGSTNISGLPFSQWEMTPDGNLRQVIFSKEDSCLSLNGVRISQGLESALQLLTHDKVLPFRFRISHAPKRRLFVVCPLPMHTGGRTPVVYDDKKAWKVWGDR